MTIADQPDEQLPEDLASLIRQFISELATLNNRIKTLKRDRIIGIIAIVILVFDIIFTPIFGVVSFKAFNASSNLQTSVTANRAGVYQACVVGNDFRRDDLKRWNIILNALIPPGTPETPALASAIATVKKTNAETDKLRNCANASHPKSNVHYHR